MALFRMVERGTLGMGGALTASSDPRRPNRGEARAPKNTTVADNDTITLMELANEGEPRCPALLPEGVISSLHS